jgi:hypothetical protein
MQKIERKHLTLRTRLKRLARKTLCFSRSRFMHDLLIGLYVNCVEFGCAACAASGFGPSAAINSFACAIPRTRRIFVRCATIAEATQRKI